MYHTLVLFSPSLCEITHSNQQFERNNIISLKRTRCYCFASSPLNCCWPLYRVLMQENGDTAARLGLGLNFHCVQSTDGSWKAQTVKQRYGFASLVGKFVLQCLSFQPRTCPSKSEQICKKSSSQLFDSFQCIKCSWCYEISEVGFL